MAKLGRDSSIICTLIVLFMSACVEAKAQGTHGTIVIVLGTDTDIVITADSRTSSVLNKWDDSGCKLHKLKGGVVFAGVGWESFLDQSHQSWSTSDVAARILDKNEVSTREELENIAHLWAEQIRARLTVNNWWHGAQLPFDIGGVFAFVDKNGLPQYLTAWIKFKKPFVEGVSPQLATLPPDYPQIPRMPNRGFGVNPFGTGADLLNSYLDNPKNKAAIEAIITSDDRKTYTAKDLERISSRYGQIVIDESGLSGSVGGELDQVHLSHNGVEWVHVKSNCR